MSRNADIVTIKFVDNEIIIDVRDRDIAKVLDAFLRVMICAGMDKIETSVLEKLKMISRFASNLREENLTISIRWMGKPVLVLGEKAKVGRIKLVLGGNIEANFVKIISLLLGS